MVAMDTAAAFGHLEIVKWVQESRSGTCTTAAVDGAAGNGHFDVVKFLLLENRSEGCTEDAIRDAAFYGRLKVLKYIVESGFASFPERAEENDARRDEEDDGYNPITRAAESGDVHIVRFLYERCQLRCSEYAISQTESFAVLEWIMQHDPNFANFKYKPFSDFEM